MLDPSIILAGQPVNVLGALQGGAQAAGMANEVARGNALAGVYRTQGPGILAGDAGALNALAGIDPMAAVGVRNTIADNRRADASLELAREQGRREAAKWAAQQDAATVARAAAQHAAMIRGAAALYAQGDRAGYEAWLRQNGEDPAKLPFDNFPAVMAGTEGALEVWEAVRPKAPEPLSKEGKLAADFRNGLITGEEYQAAQQPDGMTVYDPATGNPIVTQGLPPIKLTEQQSKDMVYYERATGASVLVDKFEGPLTSGRERMADAVPLIGNTLVSPEYQQGRQAAAEWLAAILRKDTGAAITEGEFNLYGPMYIPQFGDGPEVLAQKRAARKRAEQAIRRGLGTAEILAQEIDAERAAPAADAPPPEFLARPDIQEAVRLGVDPAEIWRLYQETQTEDAPADDGGWTVIDGVRIREKR